MREFYLCELCEAISGRINLYRITLFSHNSYARRHVHSLALARQTGVALFNASSIRGDGSYGYFQVTASLPTAEGMALGDTVTQSANAAVLREVQAERPRKCKPYTVFPAEQRATIGKYAFEHGNAAAVKKLKANIEGGQLGESTVRLFKKRYFEELKKAKHSGATMVLKIMCLAGNNA